MDNTSHSATETVSPCVRRYARAVQVWAICGAVLFAPGALILTILGLVLMGALGVAVLIPIVCTLYGAYLFYAAGSALRRGEAARGQIIWATVVTWNVLVLLSAWALWHVGTMAATDWPRFVAEYSRVKVFDGYLLAASALHVFVNGAFLIAAAFIRTPPSAETSAAA